MQIQLTQVIEDNTGCEHRFLVGPNRTEDHITFSYCQDCVRGVAVEMDSKSGKRTGRSWVWDDGETSRIDATK
jgi:hypothetical protein